MMKTIRRPFEIFIIAFLLLLAGCSEEMEEIDDPARKSATDLQIGFDNEKAILIDASHDGGVWWFPQSEADGFSPDKDHQGKALADYLRDQGFTVDELARGTVITIDILSKYTNVIRAGSFGHYTRSELEAYEEYLQKDVSLLLISEFLRSGQKDGLAEQLNLPFVGMAKGYVTRFAEHAITKNVDPFCYNAGSVILDVSSNPSIEVLGWLPDDTIISYANGRSASEVDPGEGIAAMGILHHPNARIFFIGDINGIEGIPQPLVSNLVEWAFK